MNYYSFHVGDWALHTNHLTLEEEGVFRRLLDFYYDTEAPIPEITQPVIRRLRLGSYAETVALILAEFFTLEADGWHNYRADLEIAAYKNKACTAQENGKKGGRPPKNSGLETQPVNSANPEITRSKANQEPITKNQEPIQDQKHSSAPSARPAAKPAAFDPISLRPANITERVWADYVAHRKAKKAKLTPAACKLLAAKLASHPNPDAVISLSIENGWTGVFPEKINAVGQFNRATGSLSAVDQVKQSIANREAAAAAHGQTGAENVRDIRPPLDGEFRRVV